MEKSVYLKWRIFLPELNFADCRKWNFSRGGGGGEIYCLFPSFTSCYL